MTDVLKISKTFQALSKFSPRRCCTKHDVENKIMKQSFMCHLHVLGLTSNISCIDLKVTYFGVVNVNVGFVRCN